MVIDKTIGLTKFSSNFTGLAVTFFSGYVQLTVSSFSHRKYLLVCPNFFVNDI